MTKRALYLYAGLLMCIVLALYVSIIYFNVEGMNADIPEKKKGFIDGIDVIYWINLDRATERRQRMEEMLKDDALSEVKKILRVSASDGKNPGMFDEVENAVTTDPGLYGCVLSHMRCMKMLAESTDEIALILEDDATLEYKPYWKERVSEMLSQAPPDWEIIQLGIILGSGKEFPPNKKFERTIAGEVWSTIAYLVNNKGAKRFMDKHYRDGKFVLDKVQEVISHSADIYLPNNMVEYYYERPYFTYPLENYSYIGDGVSHHIEPKRIVDKVLREQN